MMSEVPKADVVVTNPTHFAVALRYEEGRMRRTARGGQGQRPVAARIREIAVEHRVPILSAPPLARALHRHVELGQEIPAGLYTAVAEVLAWVFQLKHWHYSRDRSPRLPATFSCLTNSPYRKAAHECLTSLLKLPGGQTAGQMRALAGPLLIVMIHGHDGAAAAALPARSAVHLQHRPVDHGAAGGHVPQRPLDFAAFPAVLLFSTLLRLSLNVASTRVVLLEGHSGPDAAGKVIEAFGHFLVGGNFAVGIVVFAITVVINFMVITKGAGRIAEVGARFMLDSMPGKQMAIDADLNAGLINEEGAKKRRTEVARKPTSTAPWTVPASSCAAMPWPAC